MSRTDIWLLTFGNTHILYRSSDHREELSRDLFTGRWLLQLQVSSHEWSPLWEWKVQISNVEESKTWLTAIFSYHFIIILYSDYSSVFLWIIGLQDWPGGENAPVLLPFNDGLEFDWKENLPADWFLVHSVDFY